MKHIRRAGDLRFLVLSVFFLIIISVCSLAEGVTAMPGIRTHTRNDCSVISYIELN